MIATVTVLVLSVGAVQTIMWRQGVQAARSAAQQGAEAAALADSTLEEGEAEGEDAVAESLVRDAAVAASVEVDPASGVEYAVVSVTGSSVRLLGFGWPIRESGRFPMEPR